ncbi:hypothetical protein THRCLA_09553 [Thraustotheca clavata]|uniref:PLAC8 family protein n=1 Tax=Thraustotheca clavata TaxID=74557 RepID=A0A1V9YVT1_9STRA|nr:hypothetical protein THRCLA_09553 [Thraustotheca clavata]
MAITVVDNVHYIEAGTPVQNDFDKNPPQGAGVDSNGITVGHWKKGAFDCFDDCIPNFCMSLWFPCVTYAQTAQRMKGTYLVSLVLYIVLCGLPAICLRGNIRSRYRIPGSFCGDCCMVYLCHACSLAQSANHVEAYDQGRCSFDQKDQLPAYTV